MLSIEATRGLTDVHVLEVSAPADGARLPLDVCLVMDASGSMGDAANPNGSEDIKRFSKMDLTRRGAELIARALTADDTLSVVAFESTVSKPLAKVHMDASGLGRALGALSGLHPCGGTALWEGLYAGMYALEYAPRGNHNNNPSSIPVLILLTDGLPSYSPPEGEVNAMKRYVVQRDRDIALGHASRICKLIVIGFGYDVNSKLLVDLCRAHDFADQFVFIPDGTMLLTNFTNIIANVQCTFARRAVISIARNLDRTMPDLDLDIDLEKAADGEVKVLGELEHAQSASTIVIRLGDVLRGQKRHVVLKDVPAVFDATITVRYLHDHPIDFKELAIHIACDQSYATTGHRPTATALIELNREVERQKSVSTIAAVAKLAAFDLTQAQDELKRRVKDLFNMAEQVRGPIFEDLAGEVSSAVSTPDAWTRWGSHYLQSLLFAHVAQICTNFKDPGVQAYSGEPVRAARDSVNRICDILPVPVPSIRLFGATAMGTPVVASVAAFRDAFNNANGGCIGPDAAVRMADGSTKRAAEIRAGDRVRTACGLEFNTAATVVCAVESIDVRVLRLPGTSLAITPWHPVRVGGRWHFPADLAAADRATVADFISTYADFLDRCSYYTSPTVYNFVLDAGHVILADGVECVTLGHGFREDVVRHDFYGTSAVIDLLKSLPGWELGRVRIDRAVIDKNWTRPGFDEDVSSTVFPCPIVFCP